MLAWRGQIMRTATNKEPNSNLGAVGVQIREC
jgi:hypothetical protein